MQDFSGVCCNFAINHRKTLQMARKTIYLCLKGDEVIRSASTLPKFVDVGLLGKEYWHFYRKLKGNNEYYITYEGTAHKIQRLIYD